MRKKGFVNLNLTSCKTISAGHFDAEINNSCLAFNGNEGVFPGNGRKS
jgi:hypothetical protein